MFLSGAVAFKIELPLPMPTPDLPEDLTNSLKHAVELHQRAVSDYAKCLEFNKTMADLLIRLEDCEELSLADKVMSVLIECNPKEGSHCDRASQIENRMKKLLQGLLKNR